MIGGIGGHLLPLVDWHAVHMTGTLGKRAGTVELGHRRVCRLGFGAMRLIDNMWGEPPDRASAIEVLRHAVDSGVELIDTADSYGPETNERLIAEALRPYPPQLVIATKGGLVRRGPGPDGKIRNCRPDQLRAACEGSLRRLQVEALDLYQLHTVDPDVPYEESVGALRDLQAEGKIRAVGICNVDLAHFEIAHRIVEVVSVQNRYNVAERDSEDLLNRCESLDVAFLAWFPLGAGSLASPQSPLSELCDRYAASPAQLALAWLLHRSPIVTPLPGTSSRLHLEENLAAADITLSDQDLRWIEGAVVPPVND